MAFHFEINEASVVDHHYKIEIREPRILVGDNLGEVEYQYPIIVNGLRLGLGFYGADSTVAKHGVKETISLLFLCHDEILTSILKFKSRIGCDDDNFSFISEFSRGLIGVFKLGSSHYTNNHYFVLTTEGILSRLGVRIPSAVKHDFEGRIVLAELCIHMNYEAMP